MSLFDVLLPQHIELPSPSFTHRIQDDPDEPLTGRERKLAYYRDWHDKNDKKKGQTTADGLEAFYVSQKLKGMG